MDWRIVCGSGGLKVVQQHPLTVRDADETVLGDYYADLFVEGCLIVELKACMAIADEHLAQVLGYLRASGMRHGLLINFGSYKFQIKKYVCSDRPGTAVVSTLSAILCSFCALFAFFRG